MTETKTEETRSNSQILIAIIIAITLGALVALGGSQGSATHNGLPVFAICAALAYAINWLVFVPSSIAKTEKFYDLTGGLSYISVILVAVSLSPEMDPRARVASTFVVIWSSRLASFLFRRISKDGKDGRFDDIKTRPLRFLMAWTLQGLWVVLTVAAALAIITSTNTKPLGIVGYFGIAVWLIGFIIEVVSDRQKSRFRENPKNAGKFIDVGLWSKSRHPNYFGEIVLWVGIAILAFPILEGWQYVTLISPVFVTFLLTKVSGIPLLEQRSDEKWGGQEDYEAYKARTPVLIPKL
ncbi:MAG: DUF1295 domain-containing protein [Pseudomonadota bacterium]